MCNLVANIRFLGGAGATSARNGHVEESSESESLSKPQEWLLLFSITFVGTAKLHLQLDVFNNVLDRNS